MPNQKGYLILEPAELNAFIANPSYHDFAVSMLTWLIYELDSRHSNTLDIFDISLEVIPVMRFDSGYPALGIISETMKYFDTNYQKLDSLCNDIITNGRFKDYIDFLTSNDIDWRQKTTDLMKLR